MHIVKMVDPPNAQPGTSAWALSLSDEDVSTLLNGGTISKEIVLPIHQPRATLHVAVDHPAAHPAPKPVEEPELPLTHPPVAPTALPVETVPSGSAPGPHTTL